jgi:tRNA1Val (adenine37-N6)-methyltransferase
MPDVSSTDTSMSERATSEPPTHFRGWAKPGPLPPGAASDPVVPEDESLDAISGHFRIFQLRKGHRFSTDDVLTAWYGTSLAASAGSILDLGSGIGSVATIAAWRLRGARLVAIEAQDESVRLARKSALYNGLEDRLDIRHADFRDPAAVGEDETFDLVLGSPPYFPPGSGLEAEHPQRVACRFEMRGDISDYARVAAAHLAPGGLFACVFPEEQRTRVAEAAGTAGLVVIRHRPVRFREAGAPLVGLYAMMRAADLPSLMRHRTWEEPALIVRRTDGSVHPEYAVVKMAVGFPP